MRGWRQRPRRPASGARWWCSRAPTPWWPAPDGTVLRLGRGHASLATAGSGDVLAGAIGALAGGRLLADLAAGCGVAVHGAAGLLAEERIGRSGDIARDIASAPAAKRSDRLRRSDRSVTRGARRRARIGPGSRSTTPRCATTSRSCAGWRGRKAGHRGRQGQRLRSRGAGGQPDPAGGAGSSGWAVATLDEGFGSASRRHRGADAGAVGALASRRRARPSRRPASRSCTTRPAWPCSSERPPTWAGAHRSTSRSTPGWAGRAPIRRPRSSWRLAIARQPAPAAGGDIQPPCGAGRGRGLHRGPAAAAGADAGRHAIGGGRSRAGARLGHRRHPGRRGRIRRCGPARAGLYGMLPAWATDRDLGPAAGAVAQGAADRGSSTCRPAQAIGYGLRFRPARATRIATLGIGYGDGWPRLHANNGRVLVRGRPVPIVGAISMDGLTVDLGEVDEVTYDDEFVLIGEQSGARITADEVAARAADHQLRSHDRPARPAPPAPSAERRAPNRPEGIERANMAVPIEIDVWQGEIAELEVDAIIVPANESLFMTDPLAQSVKRRAGETVEREAVAQGPVAPGVGCGDRRRKPRRIVHHPCGGRGARAEAGSRGACLRPERGLHHGGAPGPAAHRDDTDRRGARRLQSRGGGRRPGGGAAWGARPRRTLPRSLVIALAVRSRRPPTGRQARHCRPPRR